MSEFDPYSRRELRRLRRAWLQRNGRLLAGAAGGTVVMLGFATAFLLRFADGPVGWYAVGALHVGIVAAVLHLLHAAFLAQDPKALPHVRGAWGEENTRSELQRARRRRLVWGWVDSISLKVGDLDHVVVTRRGGVVVIDSKWRHEVTPHDAQDIARSALKAKLRVEAVARSLPHLKLVGGSTARHHISGVTPVVVIWGAAQHSLPDDAMLDGVAVVAGKQLVAWLQQLHGAEITKNEAVDLLDDLERFRTSTARSA